MRWKDGFATCRGTESHFEGYRLRDPSQGVFASWNWDGSTLKVDCGWGGFWPLFYAVSGPEIWISPSIAVLLREGAPRELDYATLGTFAGWDYIVGDRTFFRAIRAIPRSGQLRWTQGHVQAEDRIPRATVSTLTRDAFVDAFIEVVRTSVRRHVEVRPGGPWLVPLSGGRDSRHLFLEMVRQGCRPIDCFTTDRVDVFTGEGPIAAELARRCGARNRLVQRALPSVRDELETLRLTQLHAPEHSWYLNLAREVGRYQGIVADGIGTDSLLKPIGPFPLKLRKLHEQGKLDEVVDGFRQMHLWIGWQRSARQSGWEAESRQLLIDELRRHVDAPYPSGSFRFWNRTRRTIAWAPFRVLGEANMVFAPYLDPEVVGLVCSMPTDALVESDLRTTAILRAFPEFADIPFESHTPPSRDLYPWSVRARMAAGMMARLAAAPSSDLLENRWLWPRLMRSIVDPGYHSLEWFAAPVLRTLMMESWMQRRSDGVRPCDGNVDPI